MKTKEKYEVYVEDNRVKFRIGVQGFTLDYEGDEDDLPASLDWMREMLDNALNRLVKDETELDEIVKLMERIRALEKYLDLEYIEVSTSYYNKLRR